MTLFMGTFTSLLAIVMRSRFSIAIAFLLTLLTCGNIAGAAQAVHPLAPPDTSSPRATLNTFLEEMNKAVAAYTAGHREQAFDFLNRGVHCLNLDNEAPATKTVRQRVDLGFKGYQKQYPKHLISMPIRKPRTRELSKTVKEQNRKKSSIRVLVEHAIGGIKRFRITTDVFRNKLKDFDDTAMLISSGLWNYHLVSS